MFLLPILLLVPAPLTLYDDLINEFFALLDNLIAIAANRPIGKPPCPDAVKNGFRVSRVKTTFGFTVPLKMQRYKCPSGKTVSTNPLVIPNGRYDIRFAYFASILYTLGISAADTAEILALAFDVKVSNKTILDWVRYIGLRTFEEHRKAIEKILNKHRIENVELDELYLMFDIDAAPYAVTLVVDPKTSLVIDIYVFRGSQITKLDVKSIVQRNKTLFEEAKFLTTDGAKAYTSLQQYTNGTHITCLQHTTRNKKKRKAVKKLIEQLVDNEKTRVLKEAEEEVARWIGELEKRLEFVLPHSFSILNKLKEQMIERIKEEGKAILVRYEKYVDAYLEAYRAYLHRVLYTSQNAALVGKLLMDSYSRGKTSSSGVDGSHGEVPRILYHSRVALTTALVEGINRVLRGRFRKALNYANPKTVMAVSALLMANHNTRSLYGGLSPYERAGIDVSRMRYNPFRFLGGVYNRRSEVKFSEVGSVTVQHEMYKRYRKKKRRVRYQTIELPGVDEKVDWAIFVRDKFLLTGYL